MRRFAEDRILIFTPRIDIFTLKIDIFKRKINIFALKINIFIAKIDNFTLKFNIFTPRIVIFTPRISFPRGSQRPIANLPELELKGLPYVAQFGGLAAWGGSGTLTDSIGALSRPRE